MTTIQEIYRISDCQKTDPLGHNITTIEDIHHAIELLTAIRDTYQPGDPEHVACNAQICGLTQYAIELTQETTERKI